MCDVQPIDVVSARWAALRDDGPPGAAGGRVVVVRLVMIHGIQQRMDGCISMSCTRLVVDVLLQSGDDAVGE